MKNIYLCTGLLALTLTLQNCKKAIPESSSSQGNGSYYLTATVDGIPETFNVVDSGATYAGNLPYQFEIYAANKIHDIYLNGSSSSPFAPEKTYNYDQRGTYLAYEAQIHTTSDSTYWNSSPEYPVQGEPLPSLAVQVSELTSTYIKGTFSGAVYQDHTGDSKSITDGKFYIPLYPVQDFDNQ